MEIEDPVIADLLAQVNVALKEFTFAIQVHEAWRPIAHDIRVQERLGNSFTSNGLNIVRFALKLATVSSLLRLWDGAKQRDTVAINMHAIKTQLMKLEVQQSLAKHRSRARPELQPQILADIATKVREIRGIVDGYRAGTEKYATLEGLLEQRHTRLAHRQVTPVGNSKPYLTDQQFEDFYRDNLKLINLLSSLFNEWAFDLGLLVQTVAAEMQSFWLSLRVEPPDTETEVSIILTRYDGS